MKPSLRSFLLVRLSLLAIIIFLLFMWVIDRVYEWGLDDSVDSMLQQEAHYVASRLAQGHTLPRISASRAPRQYYTDLSKFRLDYPDIEWPQSSENDLPEYFYHSQKDRFSYGIFYPLPSKQSDDFVIVLMHFPHEQDLPVADMDFSELVTLLGIALLSLMLLLGCWLYRVIHRPVRALQGISAQEPLPREILRFKEYETVAEQLQNALWQAHQLAQKEKQFVRSLSHELRTPMAIVAAALDLLDQYSLSEEVSRKVKQIRKANTDMQRLSHTLLELWGQPHEPSAQQRDQLCISVEAFLQERLSLQCKALSRPLQDINCTVEQGLKWQAHRPFLCIIVDNLIRNAILHKGPGAIAISAHGDQLVIENPLADAQDLSGPYGRPTGYGLGLHLAQQAAQTQGWQLQILQNDCFYVSLSGLNILSPS